MHMLAIKFGKQYMFNMYFGCEWQTEDIRHAHIHASQTRIEAS